ncbi:kinase-like protein [Ramaria rubella]|nr:kinase-like protein [Ramaria rubella]
MAERGYRNLNTSVLRQISKALEHDSAADIESVLHKVYTSYASLRQKIGERQVKRRTDDSQKEQSLSLKKHRPSSALLPFIKSKSLLTEPRLLEQWPPSSHSIPLSHPHSIIFPLSPVVCDILKISDGCGPNLSSVVAGCVLSGVPIWEGCSRAVIQVGENVVVKVAQHLDPDEHRVLQFLEEHVPNVAAPRALGLITVGSTSFMFMTMIPGTTLETRWPSLSPEAKTLIRRVLDENLIALRELELPRGAPFGSPIGRRVCKDVRRDERVSASPIYNESHFNDFLLDSPTSRAAPSYKNWLHSMLHANHRIVFSHADLHPRNVMVVDGLSGIVELSGILDWEASGFYPEYWEQLKAMNTRSIKDMSDWWDYLPPSILGYDHELMLDRVIESTVVY